MKIKQYPVVPLLIGIGLIAEALIGGLLLNWLINQWATNGSTFLNCVMTNAYIIVVLWLSKL